MAKLAFLGLGNMGRGMAERLLGAGHDVRVWNRTPGKADRLVALGASRSQTPRAAAKGADAVFAMVADDDASRAIWIGPDGALAELAATSFAIECSTLSHDWILELVW